MWYDYWLTHYSTEDAEHPNSEEFQTDDWDQSLMDAVADGEASWDTLINEH